MDATPGRSDRRRAARGAGERRLGLGLRDRRRGAQGPRPRAAHRPHAPTARARCRRSCRSPRGGAIKLTTSRYFTPSGASIQGKGLVPDIVEDGAGDAPAEIIAGRCARSPRATPTCASASTRSRHHHTPRSVRSSPPAPSCPRRRLRAEHPPAATRILATMLAWFIDLVLHLDRHLVELLDALRPVDLPDPVRGDLLRDRPRGDAVPAGRLAAVRRRGARRGGYQRHAAAPRSPASSSARPRCSATSPTTPSGARSGRRPSAAATACSRWSTCARPRRSSPATAPWPSRCRASCPSSAPARRSSPASAACPTRASSA